VHAVALVTQYDAPTRRALKFAEALEPGSLVALNVCTEVAGTNELIAQWARRLIDIPLRCAYPLGDDPVLEFVDSLRREHPDDAVVVVVPVVAVPHWWQHPLHRPPDPTITRRLAGLDRVMIAEVPWQLGL